jgi:hypothetical protein
MNIGLELITANLQMDFEYILFLLALIGSIIFMAKDFKLGIVINMIFNAALFIWFYETALIWAIPFIALLIDLVILSLLLFAVNKTSMTGGFT